jgi:hypothetical protein
MVEWFIFVTVTLAQPFHIETLQFDTKEQCVQYVNNPQNADRLAIEIIDIVGFNDAPTSILCLPETQNIFKKEQTNDT